MAGRIAARSPWTWCLVVARCRLAERMARLVSAARRKTHALAHPRSRRQARAHRQLHELWRGRRTGPGDADSLEAVRSARRHRDRGEHSVVRRTSGLALRGWITRLFQPANRKADSRQAGHYLKRTRYSLP